MNFIVGYLIVVNMVSFMVLYYMSRNEVKTNMRKVNIYFIILSLLGGSIGLIIGRDMFSIMLDNKSLKNWPKIILFLEICIAIVAVYLVKYR